MLCKHTTFYTLRGVSSALPAWVQSQPQAFPLLARRLSSVYQTRPLRNLSERRHYVLLRQSTPQFQSQSAYQSLSARIRSGTFSPASRPFSSGPRYQYQQNRYNRFGGGGRQPLFHQLIHRAKPQHFVIIGVGISGVYLYNTEVVEVRQIFHGYQINALTLEI